MKKFILPLLAVSSCYAGTGGLVSGTLSPTGGGSATNSGVTSTQVTNIVNSIVGESITHKKTRLIYENNLASVRFNFTDGGEPSIQPAPMYAGQYAFDYTYGYEVMTNYSSPANSLKLASKEIALANPTFPWAINPDGSPIWTGLNASSTYMQDATFCVPQWVDDWYLRTGNTNGLETYLTPIKSALNAVPLNTLPNISVAFWINPLVNTTGVVFGKGAESANNMFGGYLSGGTYWAWHFSASDKNSAFSVPLATWTHIVQTYDGTNVSIYGNGTLKTNYAVSVYSSGSLMEIGSDTALSSYFSGSLDEFAVYNKTLSATEVTNLYNAGTGVYVTPTANTVMVYHFNSTNLLTDASSSGNNLTVGGSVTAVAGKVGGGALFASAHATNGASGFVPSYLVNGVGYKVGFHDDIPVLNSDTFATVLLYGAWKHTMNIAGYIGDTTTSNSAFSLLLGMQTNLISDAWDGNYLVTHQSGGNHQDVLATVWAVENGLLNFTQAQATAVSFHTNFTSLTNGEGFFVQTPLRDFTTVTYGAGDYDNGYWGVGLYHILECLRTSYPNRCKAIVAAFIAGHDPTQEVYGQTQNGKTANIVSAAAVYRFVHNHPEMSWP